MMTHTRRVLVVMFCALVASSAIIPVFLRAEGPATQPVKTRALTAIEADLSATRGKLREAVPYPRAYGDAKFRKEQSEKVLPLLKSMAGLLNEAASASDIPARLVIPLKGSRLQALSIAVA